MRLAPLLLLGLLGGCASRPAPSTAPQTPTEAADRPARASGAGSFDAPVLQCGPEASYRYVAREFRCPDGTNPFRGDLRAAAQSRLDGRPHPNGHVIDLYQVPCSGSPVTVYIDMYGCPEAQASLGDPSAKFQEAARAFEQGNFVQSVRVCLGILKQDEASQDVAHCLALMPAAMALSGDAANAVEMTGKVCSSLGTPANKERVLDDYLRRIARWVVRGGEGKITVEQAKTLLRHLAEACGMTGQGA